MRTKRSPLMGISLGALVLTGMVACQQGPTEAELAAKAENEVLRTELMSRDSLIADMSNSFGDIEENLQMVREREQIVLNTEENELTASQRERILRDLQLMNGLMQDSRDRIAELTGRLDKSKVESGSLRKKLKALDSEIAARDSAIILMKDELLARDFKIEEVNMRLSDIELEMAKREAAIEQLGNELHTAYYAVGTRKELEEDGIVHRSGGVLGLGKSSELSLSATAGKFQQVDTRTTDRIPLSGKKLHFVSEHPAGSYEVVENGEVLAYVQIKDADAFWRLSHYFVAEVR